MLAMPCARQFETLLIFLLCHFFWPSHMWAMAGAMEGAAGIRRGEVRFAAYLDEIAAVLGHASPGGAAPGQLTGAVVPGARKRGGAMGGRIEPRRGAGRE